MASAKNSPPAASTKKRKDQLHPTFPPYQRWVIEKLVGIFAPDNTNVLPHIVMRWIDQNQEYLQQFGITYSAFETDNEESQRPKAVPKPPLPMREGKIAPETEGEKQDPQGGDEILPNGSNGG